MEATPFRIAIGDLRHEAARPRSVRIAEPVEWRLEMSRVLGDPPLEAALELARMPGGILATGTLRATVRHTCHRCLDEWDSEVEIPVAELFVDEADEDGADYVIERDAVDLEPLLRDDVLLSQPLLPTCPDGCAQVVDVGQSDLNTGTPDNEGDPASPFAVLRDLLDTGE